MRYAIGEKIAILRKERHITQTQLAEYLHLTPQTISRWEVGNGIPEITLLPKIAAFFDISIDELFGLTSISRAEGLVSKYSVLRDGRSFEEAFGCVNSQLQAIDAALGNGAEDAAGLQKDRDRLEALKMHLYLQQGRESFKRALEIVEDFVEKTQGNETAPWYLPMRMQRLQLCAALEKGRLALGECEKDFAGRPDALTLQLYFEMLLILQDYEKIISLQEEDPRVRAIIFPPSESNLELWKQLIRAAAGTGDMSFAEKYMGHFMERCQGQDRFDFLRSLAVLYKEKGLWEKLAETKRELADLLPGLSYDSYIRESIKREIEQM